MDIRLSLMTGIDIPIPECQLTLHQPTMKEISYLGERDFFIGIQTICIDKNDISQDRNVLADISNFQIFMTVMEDKETSDKKQIIKQFLDLIFPNYTVMFTPRSLIFNMRDSEGTIMIDENNFEFLQNACKQVFCVKEKDKNDPLNYNPQSDKAKEIAEKLMRGRKRAAELKGDANASIFSQYLSSLSVGLHLNLLDLINLTMFQVYDLMERLGLYTAWDVDLRCRLAGGSPDEHPDNWMKNIH